MFETDKIHRIENVCAKRFPSAEFCEGQMGFKRVRVQEISKSS